MLSTLVNTTWSLNNALTSYAGGTYAEKSYAVSITTSQPTEGLDGTKEPANTFDGISVGYSGGMEQNRVRFHADGYYLMAYGHDTKTLPDTWVSVDSVSFTITGGTDATNSDLIAWLEDNATNLTPVPAVTYVTTSTELTSIADAIRAKGGTSASLVYPTGFVSAINDISAGGGTKTVVISLAPDDLIWVDGDGTAHAEHWSSMHWPTRECLSGSLIIFTYSMLQPGEELAVSNAHSVTTINADLKICVYQVD